jgi:hypothetical protein
MASLNRKEFYQLLNRNGPHRGRQVNT